MTSLGQSAYATKITAAEYDSIQDTGDNRFVRMGQLSTTQTRVFEAGTSVGGVETISAYINDDGTSSFFGGAGNVNNPMTSNLQCGNHDLGTTASPVGNIKAIGTITTDSDISILGGSSLNTTGPVDANSLSVANNASIGGLTTCHNLLTLNGGLQTQGNQNSTFNSPVYLNKITTFIHPIRLFPKIWGSPLLPNGPYSLTRSPVSSIQTFTFTNQQNASLTLYGHPDPANPSISTFEVHTTMSNVLTDYAISVSVQNVNSAIGAGALSVQDYYLGVSEKNPTDDSRFQVLIVHNSNYTGTQVLKYKVNFEYDVL